MHVSRESKLEKMNDQEGNETPPEPPNEQRKPKNLGQGLLFGASNILGGAVGGLGVAVIAPVVGARTGAQKGGIIGGTVGLVSGAAMG